MLETHKEIASQKVCIDTNILIYALHLDTPNETRKHRLANEIIESQQNIYLPYNILLETGSVLKRHKIALDKIQNILNDLFRSVEIIYPSPFQIEESIALQKHHHISRYDAHILAGCKIEGVMTIYTEDLQHGDTIGGVKILNPFM